MSFADFPELTRDELAELGGHAALRAARALRDDGGVESIQWEKPVLSGVVRERGQSHVVSVNLRSTTFVQATCGCRSSRSAQLCVHALALCLEAQRRDKVEQAQRAAAPRASASRGSPSPPQRTARPMLPRSWMVVDGSPKYLCILLKDRDDPRYRGCVDWLKLEGFRHESSNGKWWLRDQHRVLNFIALNRERLEQAYAAGYTDGYLQRMQTVRPVTLKVQADGQGDGFALHLELAGEGIGPGDIRNALVAGCHYIIRGNSVHLIGKDLLERFAQATRKLGGSPDLPMTGVFHGNVSGAGLADAASILDELEAEVELPADWKERSAAIREVGRLTAPPLPEAFGKRLRMYQMIGVAWLWHLYRNRLGGVLADEMGLGKTIQAIGLILCCRRSGGGDGPILVVAPASLLGNWRRELSTWAPQLAAYVHHGPQRIREWWQPGEAPDVCLTSYTTLANDRELFSGSEVAMVIADEAQHVKNRRTQASQALRSVRAPARFVLTGTPIENSIEDLRALFAFILPGYLKPMPAQSRPEEKEWFERRDLQKAAPYILRRAKRMVAPELPEKIEQTLWCPLEPQQAALYQAVQQQSQQRLLQLAAGGASEGRLRFTLLTELLRLRQVCADPGLLDGDYPLEHSAKFLAFRELLDEAMDGGHRILVFSQFVSLLKRLQQWLEGEGIPAAYIDGSTRDRLAVCDRFNRDASIPLCLISLKAGGTGLNLTGADTVVHFDPWWNPAVEDQATDRAHRIGQERMVTSYKLVTEGTVEDKVLALQLRKAELLRDLLDESAHETAKVDLETLRHLMEA